MTTATAAAPAKRPPMPFADRVRLHPRAGDVFTVKGHYELLKFEVFFVCSPWVFYCKSSPSHPALQNCKVRLGAWRDNLSTAEIEKVEP